MMTLQDTYTNSPHYPSHYLLSIYAHFRVPVDQLETLDLWEALEVLDLLVPRDAGDPRVSQALLAALEPMVVQDCP